MKDTKLIKFLRTLSKTEFKEFDLFIRNSQKEKKREIILLGLLKKYHPTFESKQLTKTYFLKKIYPNSDQDNHLKKITDLMSILFLDLETFLIYKELEFQKEIKERLLLELCKRRKLDDYFFKQVQKIEKQIEQEPSRSGSYFQKKFWITLTEYEHPNSLKKQKEPHQTLVNLDYYLDNYYFHTKTLFLLEAAHREKMNTGVFNKTQSDLFFEYLKSIAKESSFILDFLTQFHRVLKAKDYQQFKPIKKAVFQNIGFFDESAQRVILIVFKDYALWCYYNQVITSKDLFEVLRFEVGRRLMIHNNYIHKRFFLNAISVSCAAQEYLWAEEFIDNFQAFLQDEIRENVVVLSKANILFHQKKFEQSFEHLAFVDFKSKGDKVIGKSLQIRIYYELGESIALESFSKTTLQFIKRDKNFSEQFINNYSLFIKAIKALEELKNNPSKEGLQKFQKKFSQKKEIFYRDWLLDKHNEINKKLLK